LALSFVTTAVRFVVVAATSDVGGVGLNATEMAAGAVIVTVAVAVFVESAAEAAVIVTVAGLGTMLGAV
jgi:hypothetical protein